MKYSPAISGRSRRAASSAVPPPPKVRWMLSSEMFSMVAPPTQLSVMQECFSPGFSTLVTLASASCGGSVVTVPWMLLKEMLRRTAGVVVPGGAPVETSQFAFGSACADADVYGPGDILQDEIGEGHVLVPGTGISLELDGASVDLIEHTVGHGNIFGSAAAETEDRPARAEDTVGDGYKFATAEEG